MTYTKFHFVVKVSAGRSTGLCTGLSFVINDALDNKENTAQLIYIMECYSAWWKRLRRSFRDFHEGKLLILKNFCLAATNERPSQIFN